MAGRILAAALVLGQGTAVAVAVGISEAAAPDPPRYERYHGEVVRVIDGDTLELRVDLWPGLVAEYAVRVRGIDAPELRRPGCREERALAEEARDWVRRHYPPGAAVRIGDVEYDVFAGRVVADLWRWRTDRWLRLADELEDRGYAVAWRPGEADVPWCLLLSPPGEGPSRR